MTGVMSPSGVSREWFGELPDGRTVELITLTNGGSMQVRFLTLGGIVVSLHTPDRDGHFEDVTLGYDTLEDYLSDAHFFGAIIGRYANRIAKGHFSLNGVDHRLAVNDPPNHLHGGPCGFHRVLWAAETFATDTESGATLTYTSPAGDEGYPGNLRARVEYTLTRDGEWIIDYVATTDEPTPVNLTQHAYFNLAGHDRGSALAHVLTINASRYTPVDDTQIPTGELRDVAGTPFDFRDGRAIGQQIDADDDQLRIGGGYDHNFALDRGGSTEGPTFAARLYEPTCGRLLEIYTTEPGIQFYSGNGLGDHVIGKQWRVYARHGAVALETQHFPDSPNQPSFPSTILEPGQELRSRTIYKFSTRGHDRHD
jgi:aldose 1-epimerase